MSSRVLFLRTERLPTPGAGADDVIVVVEEFCTAATGGFPIMLELFFMPKSPTFKGPGVVVVAAPNREAVGTGADPDADPDAAPPNMEAAANGAVDNPPPPNNNNDGCCFVEESNVLPPPNSMAEAGLAADPVFC